MPVLFSKVSNLSRDWSRAINRGDWQMENRQIALTAAGDAEGQQGDPGGHHFGERPGHHRRHIYRCGCGAASCGDDGTEVSAVATPYAVRRSARVLPPRRLLACDLYSRRRDDGACKDVPLFTRDTSVLWSVHLPQWLGSLSGSLPENPSGARLRSVRDVPRFSTELAGWNHRRNDREGPQTVDCIGMENIKFCLDLSGRWILYSCRVYLSCR